MDGLAVADLKTVVAPLNFLVPMAEKPVAYNYEPPPGVPARTGKSEEHRVPIRDARPLIGRLSVDKEGFELLRHQTAVKNFYDEDEIRSVYYPEMRARHQGGDRRRARRRLRPYRAQRGDGGARGELRKDPGQARP